MSLPIIKSPYWIAVAGALLAYILYSSVFSFLENRRHARNAARWGCKPPPRRPHTLPWGVDLVRHVLRASREQQVPTFFLALYEEMGKATTWQQQMMGTNTITTVDPRNIQALLATQFNDFCTGKTRRNNFFPMLGNGIFLQDGPAWEHSRAMLRPQFARDQISDLDLEEHHVQNMLRHLVTDSTGWTAQVDLQPLFFNLTLDSATEFLFGESVDIQLASLPNPPTLTVKRDANGKPLDWSTFGPDWDYCTNVIGTRARLSERFWLYSPPKFWRSCSNVKEFADYYVNLALTTDLSAWKEKESSQRPGKEKYVFLRELAQKTRDPVELRSQLVNILLAGRDTTAGLLGWTFYTLARHPAVYQQLRTVVVENFGSFDSPHDITFANLKSCTYLQHVMKEILRLYPNVPLNSRRCTRDTTLPRGGGSDGQSPVYVRKGEEVNYVVHVMHHRKDLWGDDVEDFRPDRWADRKGGWEYLPFNGGPRICLGQQFALTEAGYVIVRLVQKFAQLKNADPYTGPTLHALSVTTSTDKCLVQLREAK